MSEGRKTTTRKKELTPEDRRAAMQASAQERAAKNQMALIGGIGGGALLLIIIIVAAASSGGSRPRTEERRKAAAPPPVEAPVAKPKPTNYVRNTGAIVFVCVGPGHEEKEVLFPLCPKCSAKNSFEVDSEAGGYRCTKCKTVTSDVKCTDCGKVPRVTKLKKILATAQ